MAFLGFDHIDTRVRSLAAVEGFYDRLMPKLGLTRKRLAHVDARGDWHDVSEERPYNTVEYAEESEKSSSDSPTIQALHARHALSSAPGT